MGNLPEGAARVAEPMQPVILRALVVNAPLLILLLYCRFAADTMRRPSGTVTVRGV